MASKKKATGDAELQTLKVGSYVRYVGDGDRVDGRITWANGTHVKIRWDDGEQVTWKREELAAKPIKILEAAGEDGQPEQPPAADEPNGQTRAEVADDAVPLTPDGPAAPQLYEGGLPNDPEPVVVERVTAEQTAETVATPTELSPTPQPTPAESTAAEQPAVEPPATPAPTKKARTRKADPGTTDGQEKKLSCLDAAARVMAETGQPMTCQEMIDAMAAKGYWTSPGGQTPAATLYSAILRELKAKGADARFVKTERGKFARKA